MDLSAVPVMQAVRAFPRFNEPASLVMSYEILPTVTCVCVVALLLYLRGRYLLQPRRLSRLVAAPVLSAGIGPDLPRAADAIRLSLSAHVFHPSHPVSGAASPGAFPRRSRGGHHIYKIYAICARMADQLPGRSTDRRPCDLGACRDDESVRRQGDRASATGCHTVTANRIPEAITSLATVRRFSCSMGTTACACS